jgi:hypothetical protein
MTDADAKRSGNAIFIIEALLLESPRSPPLALGLFRKNRAMALRFRNGVPSVVQCEFRTYDAWPLAHEPPGIRGGRNHPIRPMLPLRRPNP